MSPREVECLGWWAQGKSCWVIATILGISPFTAEFHIRKARAKLGVSKTVQAVVIAVREGII